MRRYILALPVIFVPVAILAACGSGGGNGGGGAGTGGNTSSSSSSSTSTSTSSSSSSSGTTSSSSSSSSTSTSTSSSSSSGSSSGGACTNATDGAILTDPTKDIAGAVGKCGQDNLGMEPATKNCIITATGLSDGCATCFDATVGCAVSKCLSQCLTDPSSAACTCCRITNCDPAFVTCSGLPAQMLPDGGCN